MTIDLPGLILGGGVAAILFAYLGYALIRPERF
jgi:K+-transporting ATPase KdpF subunit